MVLLTMARGLGRNGMISGKIHVLLPIICVGFLLTIRLAVSLGPYSGYQTPPTYGDYEAQRHWKEITTSLPLADWYRQGPLNDLQYWGLDYPPLTAFHSYVVGKVFRFFLPEMVQLNTSRGYESPASKLLMRLSVLAGDLLVFLPSVYYFVFHAYYTSLPSNQKWITFTLISMCPSLLLIDHGHFQYNNISLGLAIFAIAFVINDRFLLGSIAFCLSMNYKQMSLYYAPAFFFFLLRRCLSNGLVPSLLPFAQLALVVCGTFLLCWSPFLLSTPPSALSALQRIFPTNRGLFEDKVASFWCALSPVLRVRNWLSQPSLVLLCAGATLAALLPANVILFSRPRAKSFIITLTITALAFFLFSYHVHEKSFLLPLLPLTLLVRDFPFLVSIVNIVSLFSMYPLFAKDGHGLNYFVLALVYHLLIEDVEEEDNPPRYARVLRAILYVAVGGIHVLLEFVTPPSRFPDLFVLLLCFVSFAVFVLVYIALHVALLRPASERRKLD